MIKKLRFRFILVSLLSILFVLSSTIGAINIYNYTKVENDSEITLNQAIQNGFNDEPMMGGPEQEQNRGPRENRLIAERYFVVSFNSDGSINQSNFKHIFSVSESYGTQLAKDVFNGDKEKGKLEYLAKLRSKLEKRNKQKTSKRIRRLTEKRNNKINDYLHKASRKIINFCQEHLISAIVIGKNKNWKQKSKMSDKNNQNFIQIPFARFIELIKYKAEEQGIKVISTEESYTSGTSFIDDENPVKENYNKSRRKYRGLFKSNSGIEINADLNGAYQILKKVFPIKWNRGCGLHPKVLALV